MIAVSIPNAEGFNALHVPKTSKQAGFSLLELLVAITIMGFLGSAMAAGVRLGLDIWQRSGQQNQAQYESQALRESLGQLLSRADTRVFRFGGGIAAAFWGNAEDITFIAAPPKSLQVRTQMAFTLAHADGNLNLYMSDFNAANPGASKPKSSEPIQLLDGVDQFSLSYFGKPDGSPNAYWSNEWAGQETLPQLVQITVQPGPQAKWELPPMIFAIVTAGI